MIRPLIILAGLAIVLGAHVAQADLFDMPSGETSMQLVTVGNPGNSSSLYTYGAVAYTYSIGKYDVTAGQYTAFLNAVAASDTYNL